MSHQAREPGRRRKWTWALVAGGAISAAALLGGLVAVFVWIGEPLRFAGLEEVAWVLRGALALSWGAAMLALRWRARRRGSAGRRAAVMATGAAALGLLFLALPSWQSPWLVPVAVAIVAGLSALGPLNDFAQRRALAAQVGDPRTVERLIAWRRPQRRAARGILLVLGLALCTVAAARPQIHEGTRMLSRRGIDVVVALDFSKSMLARDVAPSRLELAKRELDLFIQSLGGDRVGLVAFAGEAVQFPLTTDYEAATLFWRDLEPSDMPVGGTALGRALTAALRLFQNDQLSSNRSKVIIVLTDGENHEGDPVAVAREAAEDGVEIFVLGIGGESPELIPEQGPDGQWSGFQRNEEGEYVTTQLSGEDERQLRQMAEVTGGKYFRAAPGQVGVEKIYVELRKLRQEQLAERRVRLYGEAYQYFLFFGFLALLVGWVLPEGRVRAPGMAHQEAGR